MQNWEYKKLGDVCDIINGKNQKEVLDENGAYPIYGSGGVMGYANDFLCRENTIIIGRKGSINNPIFVEEKFWNVDTAFGLQSKDNYLPKLLFYFCKGYDFTTHNKGTTIPSLVKSDLLQISIPLPPLSEQKRIVKILDEKFAQLETVKANAKTNLQNAKDLFQSQLTKALSNTTWEKKRLQDCTSIIGDGLHGTPKYDEDGEYYFINGSNLTTTDIIFTPETKRVNESEYQKYKVELNENTVFLSINGSTLGKRTAFYKGEPVILGKSACYINVKECLNKYYLKHYFSSNIFQEYAWKEKTGAAIPNLGLKAMRDLPIPLPPLPEQKRIVEQLDSLSEKVRSLEEIYTKQLANCDELKQAFLAKAFNGEL